MVCMNSYWIFVKMVLDYLKDQITFPFVCQYSVSQNDCMNNDIILGINILIKRHIFQAWSCTGETGMQDWFVCIFAPANNWYPVPVFPGMSVAACLSLVLTATGITFSQKKFQTVLYLPFGYMWNLLLHFILIGNIFSSLLANGFKV